MNHCKGVSLFILLHILSFLVFSSTARENITFSHLSSSDGLSTGAVIAMLQDSKGYMWFGTYDGLNLYDGHVVTVYAHDENDSTSISNSYINDIDEDKYGNIWVATNFGLNVYHRNTKTFTRINLDYSDIENITDAFNYILCILIDNDIIWVGTHGGLYKVNIDRALNKQYPYYENRYFRLSEEGKTGGSTSVTFLYKDKKGVLWLKNYNTKFYKHDASRDSFVLASGMEEGIVSRFNSIHVDKQDVFWISNWPNDLSYYYNDQWHSNSPYPGIDGMFTGQKFNHVLDVSDSVMWLATDGNGLYIYNRNTGTFNIQKANLSDPGSLSSDKICYLFQDKQDLVWVGTVNNGINIFNPKKSRFNHVYPIPGKKEYLNSKSITTAAEGKDGNFWLGTEGEGVILYTPSNKSFLYNGEIDEDLGRFEQVTIKELFVDSKGIVWILAYLNGLFAYDPLKSTLEQFSCKEQDGSIHDFTEPWCITEDKSGRIWIGTLHSGVFLYNRKEKGFQHFYPDPKNENSIAHHGILDILVDNRSVIWIGTYHGLSMADLIADQNRAGDIEFKNFFHTKDQNSISSNRIQSLSEGSNGEILIGTETGGLSIYEPVKEKFITVNKDNGLPSNKITGVAMDNTSRIWISSNKGISFLDPDYETIHNYNYKDGLQSNECKFLYKTCNGNFFIGGNNGFNHFNPEEITVDTGKIDLYLTSVKIFGNEVVPGLPFNGRVLFSDYMDENEIPEFRYDENSISFEYIAVDYLNPTKIKYAYMLEGFDENWKRAIDSRVSSYTNLPPGNYDFKIKSTNSEGIWNNRVVSFPFLVKPPFWRTKLAYFLYVILLTWLIFAGRYLAIKEIKIRNSLKLEQLKRENENEVNQLKLAFFTNISHELRTPLTLISGPVRSLFCKAREKGWGEDILQQFSLVSKNVERLAELTDQLLDLRKLETGKMQIELQRVTLAPFIEEISAGFKSLAAEKNISYFFKCNIPEQLEINTDSDKLYKILSNLLSNAIKYTPENGRVLFNAGYAKGRLSLEIKDSGIGIKKEHLPHIFNRFYQVKSHEGNKNPGTGIGLALTRDLINLLDGQVSVESIQGIGTSFFVNLPMQEGNQASGDDVLSYPPSTSSAHRLPLLHSINASVSKEEYEISGTSKNDTILVVEDSPDMRRYIHGFLLKDFLVIEAVDGRTGLEIARKKMPDLIISDVMMPDMDGIQMGKILKSDPRTSHIPLILLTALASTDSKVEGLKTGADDYLTKPFNEEILLLKVKNHLKLRENIQQYFRKQAGLHESSGNEIFNTKNDICINKIDQEFISTIKKSVEDNIENPDFSVKMLAREAGMGNTQLFLKLKALLKTSPGNFITSLRLIKAKKLLQEGELNVNEVAYRVGFSDPKYFSKCFKRYFGRVPSDYLKYK